VSSYIPESTCIAHNSKSFHLAIAIRQHCSFSFYFYFVARTSGIHPLFEELYERALTDDVTSERLSVNHNFRVFRDLYSALAFPANVLSLLPN
jgi:hypothetical protein